MDAFTGEIRAFPYTFVPTDWLACSGQTVSISTYPALYSVIGTLYGPKTNTTFTLPNLNGDVLVGMGVTANGTTYTPGTAGGVETVSLAMSEMPSHNHGLQRYAAVNPTTAKTNIPDASSNLGTVFYYPTGSATPIPTNSFVTTAPNTTLSPLSVGMTGSGTPHENRQPYLGVQYFICPNGYYPVKP